MWQTVQFLSLSRGTIQTEEKLWVWPTNYFQNIWQNEPSGHLPWLGPAGSLVTVTGSPAGPSVSQRFPSGNELGSSAHSRILLTADGEDYCCPLNSMCRLDIHLSKYKTLRVFDPQFLLLRIHPTDRLKQVRVSTHKRVCTAARLPCNDWNGPFVKFLFQ